MALIPVTVDDTGGAGRIGVKLLRVPATCVCGEAGLTGAVSVAANVDDDGCGDPMELLLSCLMVIPGNVPVERESLPV